MRFAAWLALALAMAVAAVSFGMPGSAAGPPSPEADTIIPGRYIVVLDEGRDPDRDARFLGRQYGFSADTVYREALTGFAANLSDADADALRSEPRVSSVEPDRVISAMPQDLPTGIDRIDADEALTGSDPEPDVDIAIIDTGVDVDHPDLRVVGGARFAGFLSFCGDGSGSYDDDHWHGTHVAGIAAARDNDIGVVGVAPGARLWAVKALDSNGSGSVSCLIRSVDWVTQNADTIDVANMSIGAPSSSALCSAVASSIAAGIVYVAAAGNSAVDAAGTSPANCPDAITVSAIADFDGRGGGETVQSVTYSICTEDEDDSFACFSNFGSAVDVAAPGVLILSTYPDGAYATSSGTSMAAPHVTGAAARLLAADPSATPTQVRSALLAAAVPQSDPGCGFTGDVDAYAEPLVYAGSGCAAQGTPTPAPTPTPTPQPTPTTTPTPTPTPTPSPTPTPPSEPLLYLSLYFGQDLGGVSVSDEDIVAFDGVGFSLLFDGSDVGVGGLTLDAFSVVSASELLLSFSTAGTVPGISGFVDDSDLVLFTANSLGDETSGSFSLYFDGSDVGLTQSTEDVDALELLPDGRLLISTTSAFAVPGLSGGETDVIAFTPTSLGDDTAGSWAVYLEGAGIGLADVVDEDVNALAVDASGDVSLSVARAFSVAGLDGLDEDVFTCHSPTTGAPSACSSFSMLFDGSAYGLTPNDIFGIDLPTGASGPTPTPTPTPGPTPTPTPTPAPTPTPTPTPTSTPTPTPAPGGSTLYLSFYFGQSLDGVSVSDEDIVAFDGDGFSLYFDGSDVGLGGFTVDAFAFLSPDEILLSFSTAGTVPGISGTVDDSDVVRFSATSLGEDTVGAFSLYFDGSDVGLTQSTEDVDALELLPDGRLLMSTTSAFAVPGLSGGETDVIAFTPTSLGDETAGSWSMYLEGADIGLADTVDEDVNALVVDGSGDISLSVARAFAVSGLEGLDEDVFTCHSPTTGSDSACATFSLLFDGSPYGLTPNDIFGIEFD